MLTVKSVLLLSCHQSEKKDFHFQPLPVYTSHIQTYDPSIHLGHGLGLPQIKGPCRLAVYHVKLGRRLQRNTLLKEKKANNQSKFTFVRPTKQADRKKMQTGVLHYPKKEVLFVKQIS